MRPLRWWWVVFIALVIAAVAGWALWWLMGLAEHSQDVSKARIDAVRTALTLGAGLVGVVALVLTSRKQWLAEHTQRHTESDAAEQLASDKAPVRLAGLYALSRLGQYNPTYRQTIVDLWCAYLRMPYTPPGADEAAEDSPERSTPDTAGQDGDNQPLLLDLAPTLAEAAGLSLDGAEQHQQERQVRLTAQRLLADHLRPDRDEHGQPTNPAFWAGHDNQGLDLDLAGATLEDGDFHGCSVRRADFTVSAGFPPDGPHAPASRPTSPTTRSRHSTPRQQPLPLDHYPLLEVFRSTGPDLIEWYAAVSSWCAFDSGSVRSSASGSKCSLKGKEHHATLCLASRRGRIDVGWNRCGQCRSNQHPSSPE